MWIVQGHNMNKPEPPTETPLETSVVLVDLDFFEIMHLLRLMHDVTDETTMIRTIIHVVRRIVTYSGSKVAFTRYDYDTML